MATPVFSISVPEEDKELVKQALPELLEFASVDGTPATLSSLVRRLIIESERLDISELNSFMSRESLKGGSKRYIVITIR